MLALQLTFARDRAMVVAAYPSLAGEMQTHGP